MDCIATRLPYRQTNAFSRFALDYIDQAETLKPFYTHTPTLAGIQRSIHARKSFATNRKILVEELRQQYGDLLQGNVAKNIDALLSDNTFTVTTAHQPALLTGPLYFIYKILHAIKLAEQLNSSLPQYKFVPVYYMGSEDADLDELGHIFINGEKMVWNTRQTGAVGRMEVDKPCLELIDAVAGQLTVMPFGKEIVDKIRAIYTKGVSIQDATFRFVHELFAEYGLIVLIPDNPRLKKLAIPIFEDDLLHQQPSELVGKTIEEIEAAGYKVQAHPREINLFYLIESARYRIEKATADRIAIGWWPDSYQVVNGDKTFTQQELLEELAQHPERFSPNVILRGIFQETVLPNVVFIGGGAEIAYWLQYAGLFDHYKIPYPVLLLRNSFMIVDKTLQERTAKLGFTSEDLFLPEDELVNQLVVKQSKNETRLNGSLPQMEQLYESFKKQASQVDITLSKHVDALRVNAVHRLHELEKKMLRAEKRKFSDQQRQIHAIKSKLFPGDSLQERSDNMLSYYAKWGSEFIRRLYENSLTLEQEFVILEIGDGR